MAIALALSSALSYGISDFLAGEASRGWDSRLVTALSQTIGALCALVAVLLDPGAGPTPGALAWGAVSGIGSGLGVLTLYRGLAIASMSVVAPLCGVVTCAIPALVGIGLGDRLNAVQLIGIVLTVPAVALISRQSGHAPGSHVRRGAVYGLTAGAGFGLLFVALDQAGARHGAWPLLPGQLVSLLLVAPFALSAARRARPRTASVRVAAIAGVLSGLANLLYLLATHSGELTIVGVLSSLYPAGTVLIARVRLYEHWSAVQKVGMVAAVVAVVLVSS